MQKATFSSVKHPDPELFVVKVGGHLGTRQKRSIEGLVEKCREREKHRVIFDFSELDSMGGVVASILGDFSFELSQAGAGACYVGASELVQNFMRARFTQVKPVFALDIEKAQALVNGEASVFAEPAIGDDKTDEAESSASAKGSDSKRVPKVEAKKNRQADPKASVPVESPSKGQAAESTKSVTAPRPSPPPDDADSDDADPDDVVEEIISEGNTAPERRPSYLTLEQAEEKLRDAGSPEMEKLAFAGLLFGSSLAETCYYFVRRGDHLVEAEDSDLQLPIDGSLAKLLDERGNSIPMEDLVHVDLDELETDVLARVNCQAMIPLGGQRGLRGVLFVRKNQAGEVYEAGETLALDLLARQFDTSARASRPGAERKNKRDRYRHQTIVRVNREFSAIKDDEHLLNVLLVTIMGELGVSGGAVFRADGEQFTPQCARGCELEQMPILQAPSAEHLEDWTKPLDVVADPDALSQEGVGELVRALVAVNMQVVVPLRGQKEVLGIVALGPSRSGDAITDHAEFLTALVHQAGISMESARLFRSLHDQTLRVVRTIMTLLERRTGATGDPTTEAVTFYTGRAAQELNYPSEQMRDLLYGTALRDIGMIEISDLVLKSPRKLSPEEWKLIQRHPISGVELIRSMDFSDVACDVVLHHHERFNGEGYPHGLRGTAIPLGARIVSVVESYVAMTHELPYRAALSSEETIEVLKENWEMRYDPDVVEAFVRILEAEGSRDASHEDLLALL